MPRAEAWISANKFAVSRYNNKTFSFSMLRGNPIEKELSVNPSFPLYMTAKTLVSTVILLIS